MINILLTPFIWTAFGIVKLVLIGVGLIAAPLSLIHPKLAEWLWLWGNDEPGFRNEDFESKWLLMWDRMVRNPIGNMKYALEKLLDDPDEFQQWGSVEKHGKGQPDPMEAGEGIHWRVRKQGWLTSARVTFGYPDKHKGKNEIYFGFKIGSNVPGIGFTTQVRPIWLFSVPGLIYGAFHTSSIIEFVTNNLASITSIFQ